MITMPWDERRIQARAQQEVCAQIVNSLESSADLMVPSNDHWTGVIEGLRIAADHVRHGHP